MLKLMYITNRPEIAKVCEAAGVDRIFVDMEFIGKDARQGGLDTVQSHHTAEDAAAVKAALKRAQLLVRINPIHDAIPGYYSSADEIDAVIKAGADIIMLPYFKTVEEAEKFIGLVGGRARTVLLIETPKAAELADELIELPGVDEVFIGLNDLSLGCGFSFMFEPLANGMVERLSLKFRKKGIPFGFGGIAAPGRGALPAEYILKEHYRLGSQCVILSRSFCDAAKIADPKKVAEIMTSGVAEIRALEKECEVHSRFFFENEKELIRRVELIKEGSKA